MADVQSIPVDKEIHFSAGLAVTVGADIIADFFGLPWYVTGVTVTAIGIGMEFGDPVFSYQDLSYYYIGFSLVLPFVTWTRYSIERGNNACKNNDQGA